MSWLDDVDYRCVRCGFKKNRDTRSMVCCECGGDIKSYGYTLGGVPFKAMWYRDICETPIWITSKGHLKKECKKHNVLAARLQ